MVRLAAILLLTACTHTPEVTIMLGVRTVDGRQDPGAYISLIQKFGKIGVCGGTHTSDPTIYGPPDTSINFAGCGVRFGGK